MMPGDPTPAPGTGGPAALLQRARALAPRRSDWTAMREQPLRDLIAGATVAVVALPLALAFGIASGMGAGAGLTCAIVAGIVAAIFGGSNLQISGPTGAMTVVLVPIAAEVGPDGVLMVGLLAGLLLIGLAWSGAAQIMRFIPLPVIEGFTAGIAAVIALQQVPAALGLASKHEAPLAGAINAFQTWAASPAFAAPVMALGVAAAIVVFGKRWPKLPVSLVAIVVATIVASVAGLDVATIGSLPSPLALPTLPDVAVGDFGALLGPAVAVAALAALESLLSATVADGMTVGQRHDPDRELFGQGMANVVTPLFGGIPATAAIARTAVNVRTGGRSRLAAITQSIALLVVALAAAGLVSSIPLAALAGVLFATTLQMVEFSSVRSLLRASRSDGAVLLITVAATIVLNLVMAVLVGLGLAMIFALRGMARMAEISAVPLDPTDHTAAERSLLDQHVIAYRLEGPLFFGAAHTFLLELAELGDVRVVILRMSRIHALDSSGAAVLADTITGLERHGVTVLLSGLRPEHERMLEELGVLDRLRHENHVFATTPPAIDHALRHVQGHAPPTPAAVTG